ncbi:hypothetical protein D3C72_2578270 [compost metagenome]
MVFGTALHVTGRNAALLGETLRRLAGPARRVEPTQTSLEDVFIHMMSGAEDNMNAGAGSKAQKGKP